MTQQYRDIVMVPVYRQLLCDQPQGSWTCGHSVKATGKVGPLAPHHEHRCPNCGNVMYADHPYPRIVYMDPCTDTEVLL